MRSMHKQVGRLSIKVGCALVAASAVWLTHALAVTVQTASPRGEVAKVRQARVTFSGPYNISPALSADGRWMAYIGQLDGGYRVQLMDLQSGQVRTLTDSRDDESPSFAPNSKQLIYASRSQGREVLMTTTLDGRIKARLATNVPDVREPVWGPYLVQRR